MDITLKRPGWQEIAYIASGCSNVCGKACGFPDEPAVLPSLPITDMRCGAVAVVNIMMSVRDRAQNGGPYYRYPPLTTTDCEQVNEGFGSYSSEVQKIQDTHTFGR